MEKNIIRRWNIFVLDLEEMDAVTWTWTNKKKEPPNRPWSINCFFGCTVSRHTFRKHFATTTTMQKSYVFDCHQPVRVPPRTVRFCGKTKPPLCPMINSSILNTFTNQFGLKRYKRSIVWSLHYFRKIAILRWVI